MSLSLLLPCANCGHIGFSHDNWQDCAECECELYEVEDDPNEEDE